MRIFHYNATNKFLCMDNKFKKVMPCPAQVSTTVLFLLRVNAAETIMFGSSQVFIVCYRYSTTQHDFKNVF